MTEYARLAVVQMEIVLPVRFASAGSADAELDSLEHLSGAQTLMNAQRGHVMLPGDAKTPPDPIDVSALRELLEMQPLNQDAFNQMNALGAKTAMLGCRAFRENAQIPAQQFNVDPMLSVMLKIIKPLAHAPVDISEIPEICQWDALGLSALPAKTVLLIDIATMRQINASIRAILSTVEGDRAQSSITNPCVLALKDTPFKEVDVKILMNAQQIHANQQQFAQILPEHLSVLVLKDW